MRKSIFASLLLLIVAITASAQENNKKPHFSPEEFQAKQRTYITEKAELSPEEADAFFPLFFELQKKKFDLERNARKDFKRQRGAEMTDEQRCAFIYKMAETKVEIAKLEQIYTEKYLKVISPRKLLGIQHAVDMFQRHLMKEMMQRRKDKENEKR